MWFIWKLQKNHAANINNNYSPGNNIQVYMSDYWNQLVSYKILVRICVMFSTFYMECFKTKYVKNNTHCKFAQHESLFIKYQVELTVVHWYTWPLQTWKKKIPWFRYFFPCTITFSRFYFHSFLKIKLLFVILMKQCEWVFSQKCIIKGMIF